MVGLRSRHGKLNNKRGAALVEFAIISILLFTLVLGIIDFGLMIKNYLALSQVAREGARLASLGVSDSSVQTSIYTLARELNLKTDSGYLVFSPSIIDLDLDGKQKAAKIHLTYRYDMVTGNFFAPIVGGDYVTLRTSMLMRKE